MTELLNKFTKSKYISVDFYYKEYKNNIKVSKEKKWGFKKAVALFKDPTWAEIHDIQRRSNKPDPWFKGKSYFDEYEYAITKLEILLVKIIDEEGNEFLSDRKLVENLHKDIGEILSRESDKLISDLEDEGLSEEESKTLALDTFKYYKYVQQKGVGNHSARHVDPPADVIIYDLCQSLHLTPNQVREMSRRDLEVFSVIGKQKDLVMNPAYATPGSNISSSSIDSDPMQEALSKRSQDKRFTVDDFRKMEKGGSMKDYYNKP